MERHLALVDGDAPPHPPSPELPLSAWVPTTKFLAPAVGPEVVVAHADLDDLVARVSSHRLTLVVAQGGAGKTTLVAAAMARLGSPVAWLRLDDADDGPRTPMELVILAVDRALPGACDTALGLVAARHPLQAHQLGGVLVNDLVADGRDVAIVLDDVHHVTDAAALAGLDHLLANAPPTVRVVATGRRPPGLRLARLRAAGQLAEVGADELRFDEDRARTLLVDRLHLDVDAARLSYLVEATNGWVTALVLSTAGDDHGAVGTPEALEQYLADELLGSEAQDVQAFLLATSVLDVLEPEACRAVSGRDDADLVLADVRRRLRLLVDDLGGQARYHDLLRDHLRAELRRDPAAWRAAHQRAAAVAPPGPERIEHLLAAGDDRRAAEEVAALSRSGPSRPALADRVLAWAERLDPDARDGQPWVDLAVAAALANRGRLDRAVPLLESVTARAGEDDFELRWLALRFTTLATRDYARLGPALATLEADPRFDRLPASSRVEQSIGAAWTALWSRDLDRARRRVEEASSLVRRTGDPRAAEVLALHYSMALTAWPGGPEALGEHARWALEELGGSATVRVGAQLQAAAAQLLTGSGPGVAALSAAEAELASDVPYWAVQQLWLRTVGARLRDDPAAAAASVVGATGALSAASGEGRALWATIAPLAASALRELDQPAAVERLRRELAAAGGPDAELHGLCTGLVEAEATWAAGRLDDAEAALRDVIRRSAGLEATMLLEAEAELAVLLDACGRAEEAGRALEGLLDRVAPSGAWARVAQSGHGLVPVLGRIGGRRRGAAASVAALLDGSAAPEPRAVPGSPEVLTSREVEVLRALATGASNAEIGAVLYLSENTVKTHVKRVLAKLGSPSRTAAVARARQHGLL